MKQHTLKKPIIINGLSLDTGEKSKIEIAPASVNNGILFVLDGVSIPASLEDFQEEEKRKSTTLSAGSKRIRGVEHLLSALYGMFVDNAVVFIHGDGIPEIVDNEFINYASLLLDAGMDEQESKSNAVEIFNELYVSRDESWAILKPLSEPSLVITVEIEFPMPIGRSELTFKHSSPQHYYEEISWARTFLRSDVNKKWENGKSTWQIMRERIPLLPSDPSDSPILCFSDERWITKLRKPDEPVRHKILDLIGDLSLLGCRIIGQIQIHFPGHEFNHYLCTELAEEFYKGTDSIIRHIPEK